MQKFYIPYNISNLLASDPENMKRSAAGSPDNWKWILSASDLAHFEASLTNLAIKLLTT